MVLASSVAFTDELGTNVDYPKNWVRVITQVRSAPPAYLLGNLRGSRVFDFNVPGKKFGVVDTY